MPARMMLATAKAASNVINLTIDATERLMLSKGALKELERKRVDRIIRELYDEIYGREK